MNLIPVSWLPAGFRLDDNTPEDQFTPRLAVQYFQNIPDMLLRGRFQVDDPATAFDGGVAEWLRIQRVTHKRCGLWLRYYLNNENDLAPVLNFDEALLSNKPKVDLILTQYQLIQIVYPQSISAKKQNLFPLKWLMFIQLQDFEDSFNKLLTGNQTGKNEAYKYMKQRADELNYISTMKFTKQKNISHLQLLESEAALLCQDDENFIPHWQTYLKETKKFWERAQKSKDYQAPALPQQGGLGFLNGRPPKQNKKPKKKHK